jgi:predicted DNA binding CopG/RHH family protein
MKRRKPRLKKLPVLRTDDEAERFVETADLSQYDLSGMVPVRFEFKPKTERVNMRLSKDLLSSVKARAADEGVSYQRYIRLTLERAIAEPKR